MLCLRDCEGFVVVRGRWDVIRGRKIMARIGTRY